MRNDNRRFRLGLERLEDRAVPAFLAPVSSRGGGGVPTVADFNRDGRDDVVVISGTSRLTVSLSNGDGTFTRSSTLSVAKGQLGTFMGGPGARDVNGDGERDVVAVSFTRDGRTGYSGFRHINTWLGKGDGTFGRVTVESFAFDWATWPPIVANPQSVRADWNGDGVLDGAWVDGTDLVSVALGNPDGTYQPPQTFAAGANPGTLAAGDFDGDGWTDIVVVNNLSSTSPTLSVLLNDGNW